MAWNSANPVAWKRLFIEWLVIGAVVSFVSLFITKNRDAGSYIVSGEKTSITLADQSDAMVLFARTGKPVYLPGAGLRDVSLSTQVRTDIDKRWSVWTQAGVGRLLGPARDSPLTKKPTQVGAGVGFAWRF